MKRIDVRSIAFELTILFATLLIVTTVLAIGHQALLRTEALNALEAIRIADRLAVIASLLEAADPERRMDARRSGRPWLDRRTDGHSASYERAQFKRFPASHSPPTALISPLVIDTNSASDLLHVHFWTRCAHVANRKLDDPQISSRHRDGYESRLT